MLFHKKTKKIINVIWIIAALIIIFSMIFAYLPFGK